MVERTPSEDDQRIRRQQEEIDAEAATSAELLPDGPGDARHRHLDRREKSLDDREAGLDERAVAQRRRDSMLQAREQQADQRDERADQREIDGQTGWPDDDRPG